MCIVENLFRVFLSKQLHILLWVMKVYIIWVKGKKVTLKIFKAESFTGWPFLRNTRKTNSLARLFNFQHVLLTWLFCRQASRKTLTKSTCSSNTCLILHQLNTKPNTIKSHKIQGTKLKQLQCFLSQNKANIKHNCKSQLYTTHQLLQLILGILSIVERNILEVVYVGKIHTWGVSLNN